MRLKTPPFHVDADGCLVFQDPVNCPPGMQFEYGGTFDVDGGWKPTLVVTMPLGRWLLWKARTLLRKVYP